MGHNSREPKYEHPGQACVLSLAENVVPANPNSINWVEANNVWGTTGASSYGIQMGSTTTSNGIARQWTIHIPDNVIAIRSK